MLARKGGYPGGSGRDFDLCETRDAQSLVGSDLAKHAA